MTLKGELQAITPGSVETAFDAHIEKISELGTDERRYELEERHTTYPFIDGLDAKVVDAMERLGMPQEMIDAGRHGALLAIHTLIEVAEIKGLPQI